MKNPYRLRQAVHSIVRPLFKQQGLPNALLLMEWKTIIGAEYADWVECEKIKFLPGKKVDGTMVLLVEKGMALFIQHSQLILLEKINNFFGYQAITRLVFKQTSIKNPSSTKPQKKVNVTQQHYLMDILAKENIPHCQEALQEMATLLSLESE